MTPAALTLIAALAAAPEQEIAIYLASPGPLVSARAEATWLGEERRLALVDDGTVAGDTPGDGIYVGRWAGAPVRTLAVRLVVVEPTAGEVEVYAGLEKIAQPRDRLSYALELDGAPRARRVSAPYLASNVQTRETAWIAASIGWACLALLYVGWLAGRAAPVRRRR